MNSCDQMKVNIKMRVKKSEGEKNEGEQKEREAKNREGEHISLEYAPRQARMLSYILRLKCSFLFG